MSSILRRLTSQLDQKGVVTQSCPTDGARGNSPGERVILDRDDDKRLMSTVSFNDFSMHVMMDEDEGAVKDNPFCATPQALTQPVTISPAVAERVDVYDLDNSNLGRIKTQQSPITIPKGLKIPRTSVAGILGTPRASMLTHEDTTPRSSLDLYETSSLPTPRTSISKECDAEGSVPVSPKSPRTPGGRRKKQNKIHGLDYYEFCELVRAGSL